MEDNKQTRFAIILILVTLIGWSFLSNYLYPPPTPEQIAEHEQAAAAGNKQAGESAATGVESGETAASEVSAQPALAEEAAPSDAAEAAFYTPDVPEKDIIIETPLYRAHVTTRGAALVGLELKDHLNDERTGPYEMIAGRFSGDPTAATIHVGNDVLESGKHVFTYEGQPQINLTGSDRRAVELRWGGAPGLTWVKRFEFRADNFDVAVSHWVEGTSLAPTAARLSVDVLATPPAPGERDVRGGGAHAVLSAQGRLKSETPKSLFEDRETLSSDPFDGWAGISLHYFLYAWIAQSSTLANARIEAPAEDKVRLHIDFPERRIGGDSRQALEEKFTLYMGPKQRDQLEDAGNGLIASIDYGIFAPVAKVLLWVLVHIDTFIHDYGWSIILLTVLVRLLLFPLSLWQFKSMRAMQHIQPLIKEMREKYKADPQRQQQEMLNLYRQHKVNPFGGCLPMIAQIPIFLGLYMALLNALELRHAAWAGTWIVDLSLKDPYYVLPVLMTATTYFSMKLTPNPSADATQQKIMQFMPLIFLFVFLNMPAGLMAYWSVSNILSMSQQLYINRGAKAAEGVKHPTMTPETQTIDDDAESDEEADSAARRRRARRKK